VAEFLKHPLIILFVGALISGLLIPAITRGWQNHQKALEIKTQLVSELSKAIMEMIMAIQFAHLGSKSQKQAEFDKAYREWEIQSAVIGTKLQAYFPETTLPEEWTRFSEIVTQFYALEGIGQDERPKFASAIAGELGALSHSERQDKLDWGVLRNGILKRKSELIQKVLREKISVLR
jgi:RNase H-fold protein (predicted Holliday junction resolvase)